MNGDARIHLEAGRLIVSGDLNFLSIVPVWNASLPFIAASSELHFDFSNAIATKSAGVLLLLEWIKAAQQKNKRIVFYHLPSSLLSIASVCGIKPILQSLSVE